jgi:hypothetical protein
MFKLVQAAPISPGKPADALHDVSATTAGLRGRPGTALIREVIHAGHDLLTDLDDLAGGHPFSIFRHH